MTKNTRIALLLGAAVIIGGSGIAIAHMDGPPAARRADAGPGASQPAQRASA